MFDRAVKIINACAKLLQSCLTLCDPMDYFYSMGFSWQECWNGLPCPPPGDLPNPGIQLASPALADRFFTISATWEAPIVNMNAEYTDPLAFYLIKMMMENFPNLLEKFDYLIM